MRVSRLRHSVSRAFIQQKLWERLKILENADKSAQNEAPFKLDSELAKNYIKSDSKFEAFHRFQQKDAVKEVNDKAKKSDQVNLPFQHGLVRVEMNNSTADKDEENVADFSIKPDRGYFVKHDSFCDDYVAGLASDIPDEDVNELPFTFHNLDKAVEHIHFQAPGQSTIPKGRGSGQEVGGNDEMTGFYGHEDVNFSTNLDIKCAGCGAKFHCSDGSLPGFLPVQMLAKLVKDKTRKPKMDVFELCRRCYMLKNYNFLLHVNVSQVDYKSVMGHLRLIQDALLLLIVDMTEIRGSLLPQLHKLTGPGKSVIVVANKVDLLPPDSRAGYMKNFRTVLNYELEKAGFKENFNIVRTCFVSAKTGYGVEDLITTIYLNWVGLKGTVRGDIYMIGAANAGKSTLFNSFIQSDLCKVRAQDLVERVTTSIWPGTTLSLLKFPVMNPSTRKLELRRRRLLSQMAWKRKERRLQLELFKETGDPKYLSLSGVVGSTFKQAEHQSQPLSDEQLRRRLETDFEDDVCESGGRPRIRLDMPAFASGAWCFDTPGTVSPDQLLDLLTLDELIRVIPKSLVVPRTAVLQAGWSLLIGGLGRVDVEEVGQTENNTTNRPVYVSCQDSRRLRVLQLTVFASSAMPLEVLPTEEVDDYLQKRLGSKVLGAPIGGPERLAMLPKPSSQVFHVEPASSRHLRGSTDLLLSSLGWVLVSSIHPARLRVSTPDGRGLGSRPALTPFAVHMKGQRIPGSRLFQPKVVPPKP